MSTLAQRFNEKYIPVTEAGCWLWTAYVSTAGYGTIQIDARNHILAHRASWEIHRGAIPDGMRVCHKCDVRCCVNPSHLFLGTQSDNIRDAVQKGRFTGPRGERQWLAKLAIETVREIKLSKEAGRALAKRIGVSFSTISDIRRGRTWKHVN